MSNLRAIFLMFLCYWMPTINVVGQHQSDHWAFGQGAGLNFSSGGSVPTGQYPIDQFEGVAAQSDAATGQLLFYTNGRSVWNRNDQPMPNGKDLRGSGYSTQSALIVPFPTNPNLYYLFTIRQYNEPGDDGLYGGLYYSIVDMRMDQGLGDVQLNTKNTLIERYTTEKLTAVPHANKRDYWILSHAYNSDQFLVYLLTPDGLSAASRIAIGTVHHRGPTSDSEDKGYLKASPDGKRLAAAVYGVSRPFELYDFNNRTGVISNYRSLGNFTAQYGVSFSPDNSKLYLSELYQFGLKASQNAMSYQIDLSQQPYKISKLSIVDSTKGGFPTYYINGGLQLGVDGRLYGATADFGRLAVIDYPNQAGLTCNPHYVYYDFKGSKPGIGLPNFIQSIFNSDTAALNPPDTPCGDKISIWPNPVTDDVVHVDLGNPPCQSGALKIYDVSGRLLADYSNLTTRTFDINLAAWSAGLYIFEFQFSNKRIVQKVVKR